MKVAQYSLPLSAILVIGVNQGALAGPQSLLDPYYNVKAPTKKTQAAKKPAPRPAAPTSVTIGGPDLPPLKKEKPVKEKPLAGSPEKSPSASVSSSASDGDAGFLAGTRQMWKGFATAAKGAVVTPARAIGSGAGKVADGTKSLGGKVADGTMSLGGKVVDGTKNVGGKVADGTKSSGGFFAKGVKSIGGGFKAAGEKMAVVPKKMGEGLKVAGGKMKDGTVAAGHAVAAAPAAIGGGAKAVGGKVADGAKAAGEKVADTTGAAADKAKDSGGSIGGKVIAMPKAVGKGIFGAAAKTGSATKKVAAAPIGFFGKLNPFHKKEAPAVQTAGSPKAATPPAQ